MELVKREFEALSEIREKREIEVIKTIPFVTFYLGQFLFGIPAERIMEINKDMEVTPVPLSKDYIIGIMNLRGQIITILDLAKKIGVSEKISHTINLIIKTQDEAYVSFAVERIGDILEIPINKIENPPEKLEGISKEFVKNVYQLPDKLLLILDVDRVLEI